MDMELSIDELRNQVAIKRIAFQQLVAETATAEQVYRSLEARKKKLKGELTVTRKLLAESIAEKEVPNFKALPKEARAGILNELMLGD